MVSRRDDPSHKQKVISSGRGLRHIPASKELSVRAKILEDGARSCGPRAWHTVLVASIASTIPGRTGRGAAGPDEGYNR